MFGQGLQPAMGEDPDVSGRKVQDVRDLVDGHARDHSHQDHICLKGRQDRTDQGQRFDRVEVREDLALRSGDARGRRHDHRIVRTRVIAPLPPELVQHAPPDDGEEPSAKAFLVADEASYALGHIEPDRRRDVFGFARYSATEKPENPGRELSIEVGEARLLTGLCGREGITEVDSAHLGVSARRGEVSSGLMLYGLGRRKLLRGTTD